MRAHLIEVRKVRCACPPWVDRRGATSSRREAPTRREGRPGRGPRHRPDGGAPASRYAGETPPSGRDSGYPRPRGGASTRGSHAHRLAWLPGERLLWARVSGAHSALSIRWTPVRVATSSASPGSTGPWLDLTPRPRDAIPAEARASGATAWPGLPCRSVSEISPLPCSPGADQLRHSRADLARARGSCPCSLRLIEIGSSRGRPCRTGRSRRQVFPGAASSRGARRRSGPGSQPHTARTRRSFSRCRRWPTRSRRPLRRRRGRRL